MNIQSNLTQSQLLIWTGQKLNPNAPLYNMALQFELNGVIDVDLFSEAFQILIDKTDSLRTIVQETENVPMQSVLSKLESNLELLDWTDETIIDDKLKEWSSLRSQRNFDLSQPMFDAVLIKVEDDKYYWFFNQHHLITDGWSVTLLYKRLGSIYESLVNQNKEEFSFPSYAGYQTFEKKAHQDLIESPQADFWKQKISSLPNVPVLYGEKGDNGSESRRVTIDLGEERSRLLRGLTKESDIRAWTEHLSLFNIFSTVLFSYIYRVSNQRQLSIGTPAHNRITPEFKNTSGLFIELFPLVAEIESEETFISLFKKIQWETSNFLKNAVPGAATNEISRGFNVVLNYINATFSDFAGIPMKSDWVHPNHADEAHVLRLQVHDFDSSGELQLHFDINTETFSEEIIQQIPGNFLHLLDNFIEDRSQKIDSPSLTDQMVSHEDSVDHFEHKSILQLFQEQVVNTPNNIAIEHNELELTYEKLNQKSDEVANFLLKNGIENNKNVAILLPRSANLVIAVLGILKAGGTFIPIDSSFAENKVSEIVTDASPLVILTNDLLKAKIVSQNDIEAVDIAQISESIPSEKTQIAPSDTAYILYTSGSTGKPKGVMVSHQNLSFYIQYARDKYNIDTGSVVALFTSIGFDLTITSLFSPLVSGAKMAVYQETGQEPDLSVLDVFKDNKATFVKLTPSHLMLIEQEELGNSSIKTMVVGGEDFRTNLAKSIQTKIGDGLTIYNEYGPTEATVGCIVHEFNKEKDKEPSVPIGLPIQGMYAHVLDDHNNEVPIGVTGELFLSGMGVAKGYWNNEELAKKSFLVINGKQHYKTGDLVRFDRKGDLQFLGRKDEQIKIGGRRVELGEVESAISKLTGVDSSVVVLRSQVDPTAIENDVHCKRCGLPSLYPDSQFDEENICGLCRSFESYHHRVKKYFKTTMDLEKILLSKRGQGGEYDCISLLSGGKDSTYALAKLVELGLNVLAFTLDNGYISTQAKDNVNRVVKALGVDHMYGTTPAMNKIFVDSLQRHANVCDGCFKTIYSLSMKVALEKNIPFIVTGLSRGQFFETRLTEELFSSDNVDINKIDEIILNARKAYHQVDDAVKKNINVAEFENAEVFERVQFVDFYRYTDVSLDEMLVYLNGKLPWERPTDTGRSTNCLINAAGIYVHKKKKGFSNYAFPYSWDVRLGHKTRDESIDEINEEINEKEVLQILDEIGFEQQSLENSDDQLVAYYTGTKDLKVAEMREQLRPSLSEYMIPTQFVRIDKIPLSSNGKLDKNKLPLPEKTQTTSEVGYVAPRNDIEEILVEIWSEILKIDKIGVYDKFLELGGSSLAAIRIISRANEAFELELPLNLAFSKPTIASFADFVRETIITLLEQEEKE